MEKEKRIIIHCNICATGDTSIDKEAMDNTKNCPCCGSSDICFHVEYEDYLKIKKQLDIHLGDLKKAVEQDTTFKKALGGICKSIVSGKVEKPKSFFTYPTDGTFTVSDLAKWYEATENFYHFAKRYEKQERGFTCHVDRAYVDWLKPECKKLINFLINNIIGLGGK